MRQFFFIAALAVTLSAADEPYREAYRPQFLFSPKVNWTNDPCGIVFANGEYHLFYQYNPLGNLWGHMSWGHAVSTDLVHWQHLPVALHEVPGEYMIFSGSAVVDRNNTSGLGTNRPAFKNPLLDDERRHPPINLREKWRFGYEYAWGLIVVTTLLQLWYFRRKRWI